MTLEYIGLTKDYTIKSVSNLESLLQLFDDGRVCEGSITTEKTTEIIPKLG